MHQDTSIRRGYSLPQDQFTIIPNAWARDAQLSRRARGLLVELMSHQAGWKTSVASLVKAGTEGEAAIKSALRELKDAGYLDLEWARDDKGRRTGSTYTITDPAARTENPSSDPLVENRLMDRPAGHAHEGGFPPVGEPPVGNPGTKKNIFKEDQPLQEEKPAARVVELPHDRASEPPNRGGGEISELETATRAAGLAARFGKLSEIQVATIETLMATHGAAALVASALAQHRPDSPARFASAWIPAWLDMPAPATPPKRQRPSCGACDHGWLPDDEHGRAVRCSCRAAA